VKGGARQLIAAGTAALAVAPEAAAQQVRIVPAGGPARVVELAPLLAAPDVRGQAYVVRGGPGASGTRTVTGASLGAVLRAAELDLDAFRHAEVQAADGRSVTFSRDQALASAGTPPVFTRARFLRASLGPEDRNGDDVLTAAPYTVRLRQALRLRVRARFAPERPAPGEAVTLSAQVQGAAAGEPVRVSWFFGAGEGRARGEEVRHRFDARRTHRVLVTATTPSDEVGVSAVVAVPVGTRPEPPARAAGGGGGAGAAGTPGGGGSAGAEGAPGGRGSGGAAARATGARRSSDDASRRPASRAARPAPSPPRRRQARPRAPRPGEVSGELLAALPPAAAAPPEARPPAAARAAPPLPAAQRAAARSDAFAVPPSVWALLTLAAAAGAGFALERRRGRPVPSRARPARAPHGARRTGATA